MTTLGASKLCISDGLIYPILAPPSEFVYCPIK